MTTYDINSIPTELIILYPQTYTNRSCVHL